MLYLHRQIQGWHAVEAPIAVAHFVPEQAAADFVGCTQFHGGMRELRACSQEGEALSSAFGQLCFERVPFHPYLPPLQLLVCHSHCGFVLLSFSIYYTLRCNTA